MHSGLSTDRIGRMSRRSALLMGATGLATAALPGRLRAQDAPTLVTSIRSLSNPYHAVWKSGAEAFAASVGLEHVTLVSEGNSEKGIADIGAILARTGGNMVLNSDPNDTPDARPIVEACRAAGAYVVTQWNKPADLHPWDYDPNYVAHISFSGVPNGKAMADALFKAMGGEGGIVALGGILSNIPAIERKRGLDQALAENPKMTLYLDGNKIYGEEPGGAGARLGADVLEVPLEVVVLGNPVTGDQVEVAVRGAAGQPLRVRLVDSQGREVVSQQRTPAEAVERVSLVVGHQPAGLLLLQVSTPRQVQTVKVLKAE